MLGSPTRLPPGTTAHLPPGTAAYFEIPVLTTLGSPDKSIKTIKIEQNKTIKTNVLGHAPLGPDQQP